MPLFNISSPNIIPEVDSNEVPIDELPKQDGKRRLSLKKSFFTWSSHKQYVDKNKFLFDSCTVIPKDKKNRHNSFIMKSNKYATSRSSINYDESENEYSSGSDLNGNEETSSKDYYSMEDLDNITALKSKPPKIRKVAPLSESTLCYSSNTNTINTVSIEFKNKLISNNDVNGGTGVEAINYGFEENPNIEESINNGFSDVIENEDEEKDLNEVNNASEEFSNGNTENINMDSSDEEEDDDSSDEDDESNDDIFGTNDYSYNRKSSRKSTTNNTSNHMSNNTSNKKTVTFCDDIVIIEPKKTLKTKNIFKRAISKIIKKKEEQNKQVI
ncbi:hypothetical protein PIROE2DRAFT_60030 [Piromyces sp. E2]|nr:hypothetical protein PIROE2DRAFT_60030 [Piromyces sp. E2]|eukprot:OUM65371.1 hypothetical protein PIROE2DRAFT_60030 [Piromyces sp. E2]